MIHINDVSGKFLIAAPGMEDPNFRQTIVLICEHTSEGAFGLIVNRILMNSFRPLLHAFEIKKSLVDLPIYYGGPVRPDQGYVIYTPYIQKYGAIKITGNLAVTASREVLHDIAEKRGPKRYVFALGFSGWSANQLEEELMEDSWIVAPLDYDIIFNIPVDKRWRYAASSIGLDLDRYYYRSGSS